MKTKTLSVQLSTALSLALLSYGVNNAFAVSPAPMQNASGNLSQGYAFEQVTWAQYKLEKLQHAYHLLEHADGDYGGHRAEAMHSIKKAAEVLGVDLTWKEHGEESQWKSDRRLHEAKHLLEDINSEGGKEQPHIRRAIKELDKALALK